MEAAAPNKLELVNVATLFVKILSSTTKPTTSLLRRLSVPFLVSRNSSAGYAPPLLFEMVLPLTKQVPKPLTCALA